jgi:hypothetical protein
MYHNIKFLIILLLLLLLLLLVVVVVVVWWRPHLHRNQWIVPEYIRTLDSTAVEPKGFWRWFIILSVDVSLPSPDDGNKSSFRNVGFSSY